jgi:hypothetical protein
MPAYSHFDFSKKKRARCGGGFVKRIWNSLREENCDFGKLLNAIGKDKKMETKQKEPELARVEELAELKMVLESLPLTTEEYCWAINHLNNAQNYFNQGEVGAGLFEMRLIIGKLRQP